MDHRTERQLKGLNPDSQPASGQAGRKSAPIEQAKNGSMVQDEQDMRRLGNDMKGMKTNSQLQEDGWIPDPIQE
ncbi:hypothetical protein K0T92_18715 [Paenibacillus oenotherae]|uniref:Uncharacterized protein n=1 Tax=Paenibacillus oenotherae TaxID=1435645 RepID=A0ABS7DA48_9BACL|nr:hypothetical protein [Paenibacillus oenotherae]MBW7476755.1 hypothetical protein [Paenibacillus oenotherae]